MSDEAEGQRWLREHLGCNAATLDKLVAFAAELREENARQNLVAAPTLDELWWRHIVDSAQLLLVSRETPSSADPWLDLGSGAGFPGLIIGVLAETQAVRLVEVRRRRREWLDRMVAQLELDNVKVLGRQLESVPAFPAGVISARAFAPLPNLLRLAARFSTRETLWLLPKGAKARQELDQLAKELGPMFHVKPSVTSPTAGVIVGRGAVAPHKGVEAC